MKLENTTMISNMSKHSVPHCEARFRILGLEKNLRGNCHY